MKNYLLLILLLVFTFNSLSSSAQIVQSGDVWKYYDLGNKPADNNNEPWYGANFDDVSWSQGPSQLGYGDGDEATVINSGLLTAYFRKTFNGTEKGAYEGIEISLTYDDGAIVYLNGQRLFTVNMEEDECAIQYNQTAEDGSDNANTTFALDPNHIVLGMNVIAVEVHNRSVSSTDLSFDLSIDGKELENEVIFDFGSEWSYYDQQQEPPSQGAIIWSDSSYSESWAMGFAQLGYGDSDEATLINDQTETAYFRKTFNIIDPSIYSNLELEMLYDDGGIVYLNGQEIWRIRMNSGPVTYNTTTNSQSSDNELASVEILNNLVPGENTVAIEIHQRATNSSDISFDAKLTGSIIEERQLIRFWEDNWLYYNAGNEPADIGGLDWKDTEYSDGTWNNGKAKLGYGNDGECTNVGSPNAPLTFYARKNFEILNPGYYDFLDMEMVYDDAAVVYLNGTEVWRQNIDTSANIDYNTLSLSTVGNNANGSLIIPTSSLISGNNVLAIEVHQTSTSSSDIQLDFKLSAIINIQNNTAITRGPYLQSGTHNSGIVKYRTDIPTTSIIRYGMNINNLSEMIENNTLNSDHAGLIANLEPSTKYYYQIETDTDTLSLANQNQYFITHPTIGNSQPVQAWILGDCGTANNNQRAVRDAYYNYPQFEETDMILLLGDNAYNTGTDQEYQQAIFENMYEEVLKNTFIWSCLGNHDGLSANSSSQTGPYYDIFTFPTNGEAGGIASGTEAYYSFDFANVHFIALDSYDSDRSINGAMYNWLESDLQNTNADWIVAFWHHPAYSKGSHNSDNETQLIQMRERFVPLLETYGVDAIFSGHSHSYERSYFLNGHHGNSSSFDTGLHTVGENGDGDGRLNGDGAYIKDLTGISNNEGMVYLTAGSSGKISSASLNHEAMFMSVAELGSCILDIDGNSMKIRFLRENGNIIDSLTVFKCTQKTVYVDPTNVGANNGESWESAYATIEDALSCGCISVIDTIKIAEGRYIPQTTDRTASFKWKNNMVIQGGYNSGGTIYNPQVYQTILDGNIGNLQDKTDNLYQVIKIEPNQSGIYFKNITIENGYADGSNENSKGPAIYCEGDIILDNVIIRENTAIFANSTVYCEPSCFMQIKENCIIEKVSEE